MLLSCDGGVVHVWAAVMDNCSLNTRQMVLQEDRMAERHRTEVWGICNLFCGHRNQLRSAGPKILR